MKLQVSRLAQLAQITNHRSLSWWVGVEWLGARWQICTNRPLISWWVKWGVIGGGDATDSHTALMAFNNSHFPAGWLVVVEWLGGRWQSNGGGRLISPHQITHHLLDMSAPGLGSHFHQFIIQNCDLMRDLWTLWLMMWHKAVGFSGRHCTMGFSIQINALFCWFQCLIQIHCLVPPWSHLLSSVSWPGDLICWWPGRQAVDGWL